LLLSILLMLAAILFLPSGTRFALNLGANLLPQLELRGVDGTLTSELQIEYLSFAQNELEIEVEQLSLHWHPWSLRDPRLKVYELSAASINVALPASVEEEAPEQETGTFQLPQLPAVELPLQLELDQVSVGHIRISQGEQLLLDELGLSLALHSDDQLLVIDSLRLEQPGSQLQLSGWTEPARQFLSHLELQGSTDLTRWLQLEHWPESLPLSADLVLDLDGDQRQLELQLQARQGDTVLRLQSQVDASETIQLDYQLSAEGINPALAAADWPGQLELSAHGRVELGAQLPQLSLQLQSLQGQLRQQPISLSTNVKGDTRQWQIDALDLRYAGARAQAKGAISERLDLSWELQAPNLARLLPDARGQLSLSGQLKGALQQPAVTARIRASGLGYADQASLERLSGDVALDLSGGSDWKADLQLDNAAAAGQTIEQVRLSLNGKPEQHRLNLSANGSPGRLELGAAGGWSPDQQRWQGQLNRLELLPEPLSHWRSRAPAELMVSMQDYRLQTFCLDEQSAGGRLCLQAAGDYAGRTVAHVELDELALNLFEPFMSGMQLTPTLSLRADFSQQPGGQPTLDATLATSAGELTPAQADESVILSPLNARIALADDRLRVSADTELEMVAGELALELDVTGLSQQQRLRGQLRLSADDLSEVQVLVPDLQNLQGFVRGELSLAGTLTKPELDGEISYREGSVELPAMGLLIAPIELQLAQADQPGLIRFAGSARSGEGELQLDGEYDLELQTGELTLNGERFTAMNTQEIYALISPDLTLNLSPEAVRLGGTLRVPQTLVSTPKSRESAVQPSSDVVIVKDGEVAEKDPAIPVYADIRIELGDDVRVDALGFKGRLLGALQIEESPGQTTRATGSIQVESGEYRLYGQDLQIRRGSLVYTAGPVDNPGLDLRIGRQVDDVMVGANVSGTLREPRMDLYGEPAMPDSSVLSYLLLGKAPGESSAGEQQMMLQAALALGMNQGNKITGNLREAFALDEFGFDSDASGESAFFIGKYLSPRLYLRYGVGVMDAVNTLSLKYKLSEKWRVEAQSSELGSGADLLYTLER
jgi:translocation and assembly module TamB